MTVPSMARSSTHRHRQRALLAVPRRIAKTPSPSTGSSTRVGLGERGAVVSPQTALFCVQNRYELQQ
jgi:hypothetical protein